MVSHPIKIKVQRIERTLTKFIALPIAFFIHFGSSKSRVTSLAAVLYLNGKKNDFFSLVKKTIYNSRLKPMDCWGC